MAQKKNLLFIGANDMSEINVYTPNYQNAIFIEAIPSVFDKMKIQLEKTNKKFNTNYIGCNRLVTDKEEKEYKFNIFSNNGASSSIYKPNNKEWSWPHVKQIDTILLKSTTIEKIIKEFEWENTKFDVILDVQGAELDVLKGFGEDNFKNVLSLKTEISTKSFYDGGVLFKDLNDYLQSKGFFVVTLPSCAHCDVEYKRK